MARPKKDGRILNIRIDRVTYELLDQLACLTRTEKTFLVERALFSYMQSHIRTLWDYASDYEKAKPMYDGLRSFRKMYGG